MSVKAAGLYLRLLREERYSSREAAAKSLRVDKSQVERIEKGQIDTRGSQLFAFMRLVCARFQDVERLLLDETNEIVAQEVARALAEDRLQEIRRSTVDLDDRHQRAAFISDRLATDPAYYDRWLGYGERLLDELIDRS